MRIEKLFFFSHTEKTKISFYNYRQITVYECTFSFNWKILITTQDERILYNKIINNNNAWFWHMIQLIFQMSFSLNWVEMIDLCYS